MNLERQINVYQEIWKKYSAPIKEGKLGPRRKSFTWYGRDWIDSSNPPFLAAVFKIPSTLWERIQLIQADLERTDPRQRYHYPNYFHITLEEYGWEDRVDFQEILKKMRNIISNYSSFKIELKGLNCFPRTIIIQVFGRSQELLSIYNNIHREFPELEEEPFEYVPHASIADITTNEARDLVDLIENRYRQEDIGRVDVNEIHIVRVRPYLAVGRIETIETVYLKETKSTEFL